MNQPIVLHHYATSPFSEKLRLILGYKQVPWLSVDVPRIMPKPDVLALTGGYRRTPFIQIGADIYCDTALAAKVLERKQPTPTLYPPSAPLAPLLAQWADSAFFWTIIAYTMQPAGLAAMFAGLPPEALKAFGADRAPFSAGIKRLTVPDATHQLTDALTAFDAQLADGRRGLFGSELSIADFSVAHCLWFVRRAPPVCGIFEPHAHVKRWLDAMLAIGHGQSERLSSADALAISAAGTPVPTAVMPDQGFDAGQRVTVAAADYGTEASAGTLVGLSDDEVVIARHDERAGTVHVHFPRRGFQVRAEQLETT